MQAAPIVCPEESLLFIPMYADFVGSSPPPGA